MNTKLYSLFVFIYLIIVYCATVQGNKNNEKNDRHGINVIKKKNKKNYNKDDKHVERPDEDEDEDDIEYNKEFYKNYKANKKYINSVKEEEKRKLEATHLSKIHKAYTLGICTLIILNSLFFFRDWVLQSISNPNSYINQLIQKKIDNKNKKP
ncbi:hypothetical protein PBNK65E_000516800 [Plasmodium berghei]|uniref:Uncharacterized protein n=1 Tax=Plasmodium berghei TaxID=5821 RepID=A0A0Y9PTA2_PLABE|nr:hypothetical protein PBK173_000525300 [Plasmodium berghei]SBW38332.1 hypothetical protein PBNK65E_000516800 [Plasmodium berghei]SCL83630.1 hypothetical protein PBSP11RLL_000509600 [Plasmodium berghei]SCL86531.1 hypothetical protein PBSP11A_000517300 [Plasmodium berghei]SCL86579.1 hypothetical protein PBNK65NY_000511900 [Plasmodium berghei]